MKEVLFVFIGGGLGCLARYGIGKAMSANTHQHFPLATLLSNFLSCLIVGIAINVAMQKELLSPAVKYFLIIGFCGGFSTFSTFSVETLQLFRSGGLLYGVLNIIVSITFCIGIIFLLTRKDGNSF